MDRKITLLATMILLVLFAGEYHSPVAAKGGAGAGSGARGLSGGNKKTLGHSLTKASSDVDEELAIEPNLTETTKMTCERRYNESIHALTHANATTNSTAVGPAKNNMAYIEKWVREAKKNETDCLTFSPDHGGPSIPVC